MARGTDPLGSRAGSGGTAGNDRSFVSDLRREVVSTQPGAGQSVGSAPSRRRIALPTAALGRRQLLIAGVALVLLLAAAGALVAPRLGLVGGASRAVVSTKQAAAPVEATVTARTDAAKTPRTARTKGARASKGAKAARVAKVARGAKAATVATDRSTPRKNSSGASAAPTRVAQSPPAKKDTPGANASIAQKARSQISRGAQAIAGGARKVVGSISDAVASVLGRGETATASVGATERVTPAKAARGKQDGKSGAVMSRGAPRPIVGERTVVWGDSMRAISDREYGDERLWPLIWDYNKTRAKRTGMRMENPDLIYPGWNLVIPGGSPTKPGMAPGGSGAPPKK